MKNISLFLLFNLMSVIFINAQEIEINKVQRQDISSLIDKYAQARENKDSVLLGSILTKDVDQLVSSGKWRKGKNESLKGMMQSSQNNPGTRRIIIEKTRLFNAKSGVVDARYEIENSNGTTRKMWSTFIVIYEENMWKITAIRNMLPTGQQ